MKVTYDIVFTVCLLFLSGSAEALISMKEGKFMAPDFEHSDQVINKKYTTA